MANSKYTKDYIPTEEDIFELIKSCYEYLQKFIPGIEYIIAGISEEPQSHLHNLADACDGFSWVASAFIYTYEQYKIKVELEEIKTIQSGIISGLENSDYVIVSEILGNKMLPLALEWFDILDKKGEFK